MEENSSAGFTKEIKMDEKILLVDDDPNILNGYRRTLRKYFKLRTALGSEIGLKTLKEEATFAVVISDMKMPGMDGIQFLNAVQKENPETVRIMLTGHADLNTAMEAINRGQIFRFLTKPCTPESMALVIEAGIRQYRLIRAEKDLLDKTLNKSIKVLTEVLGMVNPTAFGRAQRIRRYIMQLAQILNLQDSWIFEMSAMLSQIGFVALPPSILDKIYVMEDLTEEEMELFKEYPRIGADLVREIPKLEQVAQIIEKQLWDYSAFKMEDELSYDDKIVTLGAQMLRAIISFDERISRGLNTDGALAIMERKTEKFNPQIVKLLSRIKTDQDFKAVKKVTVENLKPGMITVEEIRSSSGLLLVPKYQEVTNLVRERLLRHKRESGVKEPIPVALME